MHAPGGDCCLRHSCAELVIDQDPVPHGSLLLPQHVCIVSDIMQHAAMLPEERNGVAGMLASHGIPAAGSLHRPLRHIQSAGSSELLGCVHEFQKPATSSMKHPI